MIDVLRVAGIAVTREQVVKGLEDTVIQTGLKGRWQKLSDTPLMICDTGHNLAGITEVVKQIGKQSYGTLHIVWGMVRDKGPEEVLAMLPKQAHYYFCQADIPRALDADELKAKAELIGLKGVAIKDVNQAIKAARQAAGKNDFIFIGGSTFVVAEIENL